MASSERVGRLFLVGGHAARAWDEPEILGELVRLAGGPGSARIVLASATGPEDRGADDVARVALGRLDVVDVRSLDLAGPEDVERARSLGNVERATAVIFEGDDAGRLVRLLRGTKLDATIRRRLGDSLLVAGLGPAAAALAGRMLVDDVPDPDRGPDPSMTEPITGLGYLPGVVVDPFFSRDGRPDRLASALADGGGDLGLGAEAATAAVFEGDRLSVIGRGTVAVVDATGPAGGIAAVLTLRAGDRFDLEARAPISPGRIGP